jgi:hypothetical protein
MAEYTSNVNLEKPSGNENFRRQVINDNMDKVDKKFGVGSDEGHMHDGTAGQGKKISYNSLTDKPATVTPAAHKNTHASGGADALTCADIGAVTQASFSSHLADNMAHGINLCKYPGTNLLKNSSAYFGMRGWSGITNIIKPAIYGQLGNVFICTESNPGSFALIASEAFPVGPGTYLTISLDMLTIGITSGGISVQIVTVNAEGNPVNIFEVGADNGLDWRSKSGSMITGIGTVRAYVALIVYSATTNTLAGWKRIKVEPNLVATPYSMEADINFMYLLNNQNGTTAQRSVGNYIGTKYFDISINKPIFWDGTNWRDAAGTIV